jgi:hypothetical protein
MFRRTATDLDTQPTTSQQRLKFALKNARLLPGDCCCLNDRTISSLQNQLASCISGLCCGPVRRSPLGWGPVTWEAKPAPSNPEICVSGGDMLIQKRISFPLPLRQQKPSGSNLAFAHVNLCCIVVGRVSRSVAIRLNTCSNLVRNNFFFKTLQWFFLISKLSQTQFDSP